MSRTLIDTFVRSDGALGSVPAGDYSPAVPWEVLSGTFSISGNKGVSSTTPGNNPMAVVNIGKRSNGSCDVYVEAGPNHVYGNALYARVVDVNNWIRTRIRSYRTSYQYYVTEYRHYSSHTEYLINDYYYEYQHTTYTTEYQYSQTTCTCTSNGWGSWTNSGSPTACRVTSPSPPGDVYGNSCCPGWKTREYRYVNSGPTNFCSSTQTTFQLQYRNHSISTSNSTSYTWATSSPGSGWTATGSSRQVATGSYWDTNPSGATSTRTTYAGQYWSRSSSPSSPDTYSGTSKTVVDEDYWDTDSSKAYTETRQAGPYTSYSYYYARIVLEKCVAGTVTQLGEYADGSSTAKTLVLMCEGDQIDVRYGSVTSCITVTDGAHRSTGIKAGFGGGPSDYNPTNPSFGAVAVMGLSPERYRASDGTWKRLNRKIRVNGQWLDYDTRPRS